MTPPARQRARYALYELRRAWPALVVAAAMVVAAIYFALRTGHWVAWMSAAAPLAVVVYAAAYWAGSGGAVYEVGPLTVVCRPEGYVPRPDVQVFVDRWWDSGWKQWSRRHGHLRDDLLDGVTYEIAPTPPTIPGTSVFRLIDEHGESVGWPDVDFDTPGDQAWGMTYPGARHTMIAADRATDLGVGGHELDLQAADAVRGDASEGSDLEWLESEGIR